MTVQVKKISPKEGILAIGGLPITGYGTGTYLELVFPNPLYNETDGADGEIAINEVATAFKADLTIQLLETATIQSALWALLVSKVTFPIVFKDLRGVTVWESTDCWFKKPPDFTKDKDNAVNRAWAMTLPEVIGLIGGN